MLIKGLQPLSLIDYPGHLACIVFTPGCNMRCPYCYNKDLVLDSRQLPTIVEDDFFKFLETRKGLLEAVVITGGEPTLHPDLFKFISRIKKAGFKVKLDTNGTKPAAIKKLIEKGLVDYVAMDIKTSEPNYQKTTRILVDLEDIKTTAKLLMRSGVDYEFRTTVVPGFFADEDVKKVANWLKGAKRYYLQQFKPLNTLDPSLCDTKPYTEKKLKEFAAELSKTIETVEVR